MTRFFVSGTPVPKQSFKMGRNGGYTDTRVITWQDIVAYEAKRHFTEPLTGDVNEVMVFTRPNRRRVDCENLVKAVNDALNGIAFVDDSQVVHQDITKRFDRANPGVWIEIEEA